MKEHDHATIHKPETKVAHDEAATKAHEVSQGRPSARTRRAKSV
jgi:hypothetical protein